MGISTPTQSLPAFSYGPVAVCDLGTFSGLILIARRRRGVVEAICEEAHTVDLFRESRSPNRIGRLAMERAEAVLDRLNALAAEHDCRTGAVICTEAVRSAINRDQVTGTLGSATRFPVRVVSQRREANLAATGALSGLPASRRPSCVIDIGGGSTEILFPRHDGWAFRGKRFGASRATGEWLKDGRPEAEELRVLASQVYRSVRLPATLAGHRIVGVGGTITTLAAIERGLTVFRPAELHGMRMPVNRLAALADRLAGLSESEIAGLIPFDPERARVLTAGTFLWAGVLNRVGAQEVTVSVRGVRWGVAVRLLDGERA